MKRVVLVISSLCVLGGTAFGYQLRHSSSGAPLRWPDGEISVELALGEAPPGVSGPEATMAAERAFASYIDVIRPMAPGVLVATGRQNKAQVTPADGVATVVWVHEGWDDEYDPNALAVTITTYDTSSGRIEDADIVVNAGFPWTGADDCDEVSYDLQSVLAHEVGHLFGLGHDSEDQDATMYPSAGVCETKKRDLGDSDVAGLQYLYVQVAPPEPLACSFVAGGRPLLASVWWVLGFFGVAWRRRLATALLLLGGLASSAGATTLKRLSLEAAGKGASVVARGKVRIKEVRRVNGRVYTDSEMVVAECLKGACGTTLTIRQLGGEIDGQATEIIGNAELTVGGEVVVMLRARRDGTFAPVGMAQGVFRVERNDRGETQALVRDLRGLELVGEGVTAERVRPEALERALGERTSR